MTGRLHPHRNELVMPDGIDMAVDLDSVERHEIEWLQQRNLAAMLEAARRAPAVRARLAHLDEVVGIADLRRLPLLTATELAAGSPPGREDFVLGRSDPGLVLRSSGTAGKSKVVYHSWRFDERVHRLGARGVRAALPQPPRRMANCMFTGELTGAFLFVQNIARLLPALVFPLGNRIPVADTAELIHDHAVDTVVSGPAYGTELVTSGQLDRLTSLRTLLYLGEPMGQQRRHAVAETMPELTVRSLGYSTSETGPIGYQCGLQADTTHHVHEDVVAVEIVDGETGKPVPDGTVGEVVVTPLTDSGMALFRYRVGDRGWLRPEPCPCGSASRLLTLLGRSDQSITVDVTTISSDQLMARLARLGVTDPADCQLQVLWDFPVYRVRLLLSPGTPEGITRTAVSASLRDASQFNRVLTSPRCAEFTVERVAVGEFARSERGKVPVLYQRLGNQVN
jgi:phenylacetate-CoA ligase